YRGTKPRSKNFCPSSPSEVTMNKRSSAPRFKAPKAVRKKSKRSQSGAINDRILSHVYREKPTGPSIALTPPVALPDHGTTDGRRGGATRGGKKVQGKKVRGDKSRG